MTFETFERRYLRTKASLTTVAKDLERRLRQGLSVLDRMREKKHLPVRQLRTRLVEARLKDCDSLYTKVLTDTTLSFGSALTMGSVRDLIGGRIVCRTLRDVEYLDESFRKDTMEGLQYVEPPKDKKWLTTPNKDSGYRAIHIDVKWPAKRSIRHAEVQLRTMLQDAWATLLHEDLYKAAHEVMPEKVSAEALQISDRLHRLDKRAQQLVEEIEQHRLYGHGRIRTLDAINRAFYALASFSTDKDEAVSYKTVQRRDRYLVAPTATFDFTLRAECKQPRTFRFPMAGDTENKRCEIRSVKRLSPTAVKLSPSEYELVRYKHPNRMATLRANGPARKLHNYRIVCSWAGVFELPIEYVWCPWKSLYPRAAIDYELQVEFVRRPQRAPVLFDFEDFEGLDDVVNSFLDGKGERGRPVSRGSHFIYVFKPEQASKNFICLFSK